jgi:hypothetical protein
MAHPQLSNPTLDHVPGSLAHSYISHTVVTHSCVRLPNRGGAVPRRVPSQLIGPSIIPSLIPSVGEQVGELRSRYYL